MKDNLTKFGELVENRVNRQDQNYFSPGGTFGGNFTLLTKLANF